MCVWQVCGICFFHWVVSEVCLCTSLEHAVLVLESIGVTEAGPLMCFSSELLRTGYGVLCRYNRSRDPLVELTLIEAHFSSFCFQVFVPAVLRWWPFTFRPLGVQYRGSPSACVAFSQHHTFRKPCCSMKAAQKDHSHLCFVYMDHCRSQSGEGTFGNLDLWRQHGRANRDSLPRRLCHLYISQLWKNSILYLTKPYSGMCRTETWCAVILKEVVTGEILPVATILFLESWNLEAWLPKKQPRMGACRRSERWPLEPVYICFLPQRSSFQVRYVRIVYPFFLHLEQWNELK